MNTTETALYEKIRPIIETGVYRHSSWGIGVADLATGEMLLDLDGDKLFVPGSTAKIWSCATALDTFGAGHHFTTPIHLRGDVSADGTLTGDLILRASGDPNLSGRMDASGHLSFTHSDHTYADVLPAELTGIDPLEGIDNLVQQLVSRCIRRVHDVLVDDRLFNREGREDSGFVRSSPVMINDNVIDLVISPGQIPGEPARVKTYPVTRSLAFDFDVKTVKAGEGNEIRVVCVSPYAFIVEGCIEVNQPPMLRLAWLPDPAGFARSLLIERLEEKGVEVERGRETAPDPKGLPDPTEYESLPVIARRVSAPFSETLKVVLKVSHNPMADVLPQLVASQHGKRSVNEGLRLQGTFLERIGIEKGSVCFGSGSGGSPSDRVTPRATLQLLRYMASRPDAEEYRVAMPNLGVDGTLHNAVKPNSPARGKVFAKTGTVVLANSLDGSFLMVSKALAGYMNAASGRKVVLALFVNQVPIPSFTAFSQHGEVLGKLCEIFYQGL
jgi:serine-type D-Ala-D-Ala carboxypeptidase/endopeptidase (penicillin-binding protein 4)